LPPALKQLSQLLTKGLRATATLWPPLQKTSQLVRQAAQILANQEQQTGAQVRKRYLAFVKQMQEQQADLGPLGETIAHFCQITHNFAPGLFQCYDVAGLPCTNNALEECFGMARPTGSDPWGGRPWISARRCGCGQSTAALLG
jgi:hypothetical protein